MVSELIIKILRRFPVIKRSKLFDFCISIFLQFLLKTISNFFKDKIDEKLIVLGSYGGGAFVDNTRYIFKFLIKRTDYNVIWVTKHKKIASEIRKQGGISVPFYNINTMKLLRRAKYIFMTHGAGDVLPIKFSPKTTIILTWHGTPIKKINLDLEKTYAYSKWGNFLGLKLKYDQYVDYLLTPTRDKKEHKILSNAFKISPRKILSLGYPKLDLLFNQNKLFFANLKNKYEIPKDIKKIILYCPTWRDDFTLNFPFKPEQLKKLNNYLEQTNSIFLIKAHMFVKEISFKDYHNIRIALKNADIEELYLITDILITDYSSTMLDFSLLDRPILLYPYDLEDYLETRGLYYNLEDIAPGPIFFNADDLINGIRNIDKIDKEYKEKRIEIQKRFNKYYDNKSTERVLNFLGIKYR